MGKRHIIWQDWEMYSNKEADKLIKNLMKDNDVSYDGAWEMLVEENGSCWGDEKSNISKQIDGLAIADLGLWDGRRSAYRFIKNMNECLDICCGNNGYGSAYVEGYDLCAENRHHDGTNYCKFYEIREGAREKTGFNSLIEKIYMNIPVTRKEILKYLRPLGRDVRAVYGW